MSGLFTHETKNVEFVLWVDGFLVKYITDEDANHFLTALQEVYKTLVDKKAERYVGLNLDWDWSKITYTISMHGYINTVLHNFNHPEPKKRKTHRTNVKSNMEMAKNHYLYHQVKNK